MFTPTVFKILLFEGRSALAPAQQVPRSERVNILFCGNEIIHKVRQQNFPKN